MQAVSLEEALSQVRSNMAVLVDVREEKEFKEGHLKGAVNLPSTKFSLDAFEPFKSKPVYLVCQSQNRATAIHQKLVSAGLNNSHVLSEGYNTIPGHLVEKPELSQGWTIDRQFRMTLGILMVLFLLGKYLFHMEAFIAIPIILATGLVFTSIIDRCYMRMGIALLPWNRGKKM